MYVCMYVCMYVYVPHACLLPKVTARGLWIPLEQELQTVVNLHVGAGNQTWVLCKRGPSPPLLGPCLSSPVFQLSAPSLVASGFFPEAVVSRPPLSGP